MTKYEIITLKINENTTYLNLHATTPVLFTIRKIFLYSGNSLNI